MSSLLPHILKYRKKIVSAVKILSTIPLAYYWMMHVLTFSLTFAHILKCACYSVSLFSDMLLQNWCRHINLHTPKIQINHLLHSKWTKSVSLQLSVTVSTFHRTLQSLHQFHKLFRRWKLFDGFLQMHIFFEVDSNRIVVCLLVCGWLVEWTIKKLNKKACSQKGNDDWNEWWKTKDECELESIVCLNHNKCSNTFFTRINSNSNSNNKRIYILSSSNNCNWLFANAKQIGWINWKWWDQDSLCSPFGAPLNNAPRDGTTCRINIRAK